MSEYKIIDLREDNARDKLSAVLECPKLRFYRDDDHKDEEDNFINNVNSFGDCKFPFILVDTRTNYKQVLTDAQNGFGFESKEQAVEYFSKVKNNNTVYTLAEEINNIDNIEDLRLFRNGNRLDDYLNHIQLPLSERRCSVIMNEKFKEVIVTEVIGNSLTVVPLRFVDSPVERQYQVIDLANVSNKDLVQMVKGYDINLEEFTITDDNGREQVDKFNQVHEYRYLMAVTDKGSDIYSFIGRHRNFNDSKQASEYIEKYKEMESAYIAVSHTDNENSIIGGIVSTSSTELEKYILNILPNSRTEKKLYIYYFFCPYIKKQEIGDLSHRDKISIELVRFY